MARVTNRQLRNVGNLGDIVKHAALVELATFLARDHGDVSFVDTHAFQLYAPLADRARWDREVRALVNRHEAYARYEALERASLERTGEYRCSSGLVIDVLGEKRAHAVLGEANAATRAVLASQVKEEQLENVLVAEDAARVDDASRVREGATLLVHVDPFTLSDEVWSEIAPALDAMCGRSARAVIVAYRYSRNASAPWPRAPTGTTGPIGTVRHGPHDFAAYASSELVDDVHAVCASLGWSSR
jgi:23S rRNA A2030 N6-methylase RlmJ